MTEPMPCTECRIMFEAKDHFCFACYGALCTRIMNLDREKSDLTDQVMGLSRIIRSQLKQISSLIQTDLPFDEIKKAIE